MENRILSIILATCAAVVSAAAHNSLSVTNFSHHSYNGGVQNWGICAVADSAVYAGNSDGLLRWNGNDWQLFSDQLPLTVRACHYGNGRLYTAGDNHLGYWTKNASTGQLSYTSLTHLADSLGAGGDTFWSIAQDKDGTVYFQSFSNLLRYDGNMNYLIEKDCYQPFLISGNDIFVQKNNGPLFCLKSGKLTQVCDDIAFTGAEARFIAKDGKRGHIIAFSNGHLYRMNGDRLHHIGQICSPEGKAVRIECGTSHNGIMAIGTIGNGIFVLDLDGNTMEHIGDNRLQDLNVHGMCFTSDNTLWLSLDYGIASVTLNPSNFVWKSIQEIGAFFDAEQFGEDIYVATNKGLYTSDINGNNMRMSSRFYPLSLKAIKGELLCGAMDGVYKKAKGKDFVKFADINGVRQSEYLAVEGEEYIFMRPFSGISILKYNDTTWKHLTNIDNHESFVDIMPENLHTIWALSAEKGLFRIKTAKGFTEVISFETFTDIDGFSDYSRIRIARLQDRILFFCPKGVYSYEVVEKTFRRQDKLSSQIKGISGLQAISTASGNGLWVASEDELHLYSINDMQATPLAHQVFAENRFMRYDNRINIKPVGDSLLYVSTLSGLSILNSRQAMEDTGKLPLYVESVSYMFKGKAVYLKPDNGRYRIPYNATNITIEIATGLQPGVHSISWRLQEHDGHWSHWQNSGSITFTNLAAGEHTLEIRGAYGNSISMILSVPPPIARRWWAILSYIIAIAVVIGGIAYWSISHRLLHEKAHSQEIKLRERMQHLVQKQEILDTLSAEVQAQKKQLGDKYPDNLYLKLMKIINDGATGKDKLLSLENYFVESHYEFMLKMKKRHPDLSSSELKFCCLLRANLTTKEMAAIMGIAIRSVELKRYRLKQHLALDHDTNLITYILSI